MSVKFLSAILGPEMGAPILWTPGKMPSFCRKTSMSIKFLVLGGGGESADFIFMGAGIFLIEILANLVFSLSCFEGKTCCDLKYAISKRSDLRFHSANF